MSRFQKATKREAKLRLALDGPSGSGKTFTALSLATNLGKRVALIDTERGSASKYADLFEFDVLDLDNYDPNAYIEAVREAGDEGYDVIIVDSLSHAWEGTLALKDAAQKRSASNDGFGAWREVTPVHNRLVDTLLRSPAHLIVTMRVKTEYVIEKGDDGKNKVRKVGLKPIQRDGVEYEFDVVADLDLENTLVVSKSRIVQLSGAVVSRPGRELAEHLRDWLTGEPVATRLDVDALVARMNALPEDVRVECKNAFVRQFGRPEQLLASQVSEAGDFVATFETADERGETSRETRVEDDHTNNGSTNSVENRESEGAPPTPAPDNVKAELAARRDALGAEGRDWLRRPWIESVGQKIEDLTADKTDVARSLLDGAEAEQKKVWDKRRKHVRAQLTKAGVKDEQDVDAIVLAATGGDTSSTAQLTEAQLAAVLDQIRPLLEQPGPEAA